MFSIFGPKKQPPHNLAASAKGADTDKIEQSKALPDWMSRLKGGLSKTRALLNSDVTNLFALHAKVDESLFEELEAALISADVGIRATTRLIEQLRRVSKEKKIVDGAALQAEFKELLVDLVLPLEKPLHADTARPFVIMVAGVNGAGKTTTIGKLAKYFQSQG